jgi:hypothetical protein
MVDRGMGDARNIFGVIVHRDVEKDQCKIAVKAGVLKEQYSRNQFDLCPQRLLDESDVKQDISVSLRAAVTAQSSSGLAKILPNATAVEQRNARQIDVNASRQSCSITLDAIAV